MRNLKRRAFVWALLTGITVVTLMPAGCVIRERRYYRPPPPRPRPIIIVP